MERQNMELDVVPDSLMMTNENSQVIAPGEGRIPTNWMRDKLFDVNSFPKHHPSGKYGVYQERKINLSPQKYYHQRILNCDERFAKDPGYIFMAQHYVERNALERKINISCQKGKVTRTTGQGIKVFQVEDAYSVFSEIRGSPKYWSRARNEIFAKLEQLGAFHLFFTLSCGEKRYFEIFTTLLQKAGHKITYKLDLEGNWTTEESEIFVDGIPLWTFVEERIDVNKLLQENTLLVTRVFENRVKSLFKNTIFGKGKSKIPVKYYTYRTEFQARGSPHIHCVLWLEDWVLSSNVEKFVRGEYDEDLVIRFIDEAISCSLNNENDKVNLLVRQLQNHKHTKTCRKYGTTCRFGFPKLPSDETLIAKPLSDELPEDEKTQLLEKSQSILKRVGELLQDEDLNEEKSLAEFLEDAGIDYDDYKKAIRISENRSIVILKRTVKERFINNYNKEWLEGWNSNIDIQFCYDPFAVATYICDYLMKSEEGMTELFKKALKENTHINQKDTLLLLLLTLLHGKSGT